MISYIKNDKVPRAARHYYELGAIGGNLNAMHDLACLDVNEGNYIQAFKHLSLKNVKKGYASGYVTKDECSEALWAYHKQQGEIRSAMRVEALFHRSNHSVCLDN